MKDETEEIKEIIKKSLLRAMVETTALIPILWAQQDKDSVEPMMEQIAAKVAKEIMEELQSINLAEYLVSVRSKLLDDWAKGKR